MTGETGIYTKRNPDTVRGTDVVFISHERFARVQVKSYLDVAPELVVEVKSPTNTAQEIQQKVEECLAIGVNWAWVVAPNRRTVTVHQRSRPPREFGTSDVLAGEGILRALQLAVGGILG